MKFEAIVEKVKKAYAKADLKKLGNEFALELDIYGEGEGAFYVEFKNGVLSVEPFEYYTRNAKLFAEGDTYVAIASGKLSAAKAIEDGILTFEGDIEAAKKLDLLASAPAAKKAPAKKAAPAAKKAVPAKSEAKAPAAKKAAPAKTEAKAPAKKTASAEKAPAKETAKKTTKTVK